MINVDPLLQEYYLISHHTINGTVQRLPMSRSKLSVETDLLLIEFSITNQSNFITGTKPVIELNNKKIPIPLLAKSTANLWWNEFIYLFQKITFIDITLSFEMNANLPNPAEFLFKFVGKRGLTIDTQSLTPSIVTAW